MKEFALTTKDNPYSPFDKFDQWWNYDIAHSYKTCERLARVAFTDDTMTPEEYNKEIQRACNQVVIEDPLDIFKVVSRNAPNNT